MNWLWNIAAQKAVRSVVQAIIAGLAGAKTQAALTSVGVNVQVDPVVASAALYGALEFVRNFAKNKLGVKFL